MRRDPRRAGLRAWLLRGRQGLPGKLPHLLSQRRQECPQRKQRSSLLLVQQRLHRRLRRLRRDAEPRGSRQPALPVPGHERGAAAVQEPHDRPPVVSRAGRDGPRPGEHQGSCHQAQLQCAQERACADDLRPAATHGQLAGRVRQCGGHLLLLALESPRCGAGHRPLRLRRRPVRRAGHRWRGRAVPELEPRQAGRPRQRAAADGAADHMAGEPTPTPTTAVPLPYPCPAPTRTPTRTPTPTPSPSPTPKQARASTCWSEARSACWGAASCLVCPSFYPSSTVW